MDKYDISSMTVPVTIKDEDLLLIPDLNNNYCFHDIHGHDHSIKRVTLMHKWIINLEKNINLKFLIKDYLKKYPNDINAKTDNGYTPIMILCKVWNDDDTFDDMFKFLANKGANLNMKDNTDHSVLFCLLERKCSHTIMDFFIKMGGNIHVKDNGDTALTYIVRYYDKNLMLYIIEILCSNGANVNEKDNDGNTPFILAFKRNNVLTEVKKYLLSQGADINAQTTDIKDNAFLIFLNKALNDKYKYANVLQDDLKLLLKNKANVNVQPIWGTDVICFLKNHEHKKISKYILDKLLRNKKCPLMYPVSINNKYKKDNDFALDCRIACALIFGTTNTRILDVIFAIFVAFMAIAIILIVKSIFI